MNNNYTKKITNENGTICYYNDKGQFHRTDGPAIEYADGGKDWYVNGKLHRTDGPAVECADGTKYWYINDELHRQDGPAIEYSDGSKEWWVNGKRLTEEEVRLLQNEIKIKKALGLLK